MVQDATYTVAVVCQIHSTEAICFVHQPAQKGSYCELMFALRPEARGEGTKVDGKCSGEKRKAAVAAVYTRAR